MKLSLTRIMIMKTPKKLITSHLRYFFAFDEKLFINVSPYLGAVPLYGAFVPIPASPTAPMAPLIAPMPPATPAAADAAPPAPPMRWATWNLRPVPSLYVSVFTYRVLKQIEGLRSKSGKLLFL